LPLARANKPESGAFFILAKNKKERGDKVNITMRRLEELCKEATEILEKVSFEPYFIKFWKNEIWMQGDHTGKVESELIKRGFKWERSFEDNKKVFLVFRKQNVKITLVRQY